MSRMSVACAQHPADQFGRNGRFSENQLGDFVGEFEQLFQQLAAPQIGQVLQIVGNLAGARTSPPFCPDRT